ncbi:MAG: hypothetical protein LBM02_08975 [Lachnospiraceae bacterium]|nr:hypothetical protein [Lachnospiraceae bacterium]
MTNKNNVSLKSKIYSSIKTIYIKWTFSLKTLFGIFMMIVIISITLNDFTNISFAENNITTKEELITKNKDYSVYFRTVNTGNLIASYSDVTFSDVELLKFFDIKSEDNTASLLEKKIKELNADFRKLLIKRSGLLLRDTRGYEITEESPNITLVSVTSKNISDGSLLEAKLDIHIDNYEMPINMFSSIYKKETIEEIKNIPSSRVKIENEYVTKYKDNNQVVDSTLNTFSNDSNKSVVQQVNPESSERNNLNLVSIQTMNIAKKVLNSNQLDNISIEVPKLNFEYIILHSYVVTGSLGVLFLLLTLIMIVSSAPVFSWMHKREQDIIDKVTF